jgi:N-acetyl-anhydromuramyl-L-alanine amidase AmpD
VGVAPDEIHQYVLESHKAWHAGNVREPRADLKIIGNPNDYSIGIEHEGLAETEPPDSLYKNAAKLLADVCKRNKIPCDRMHVVGHHETYAVKPCPGKLDLDKLVALASGILGVISDGETLA